MIGDTVDDLGLADVLAGYSLTADDVPGLAEEWSARFAVLAGERPVTVDQITDQIMGNPNFGRLRGGPYLEVLNPDSNGDLNSDGYTNNLKVGRPVSPDEQLVLRIHTRNGLRNRDHTCNDDGRGEEDCLGCTVDKLQAHPLYLEDADNDFDGTYADFLFTVPPEHRDAFIAAHANSREASDWDHAATVRRSVTDGQVAPWTLLATDADLGPHSDAVTAVKGDQLLPYQRERIASQIESFNEATAIMAAGQVDRTHWGKVITVPAPGEPRGTKSYGLHNLGELAGKARAARTENLRLTRIRSEIESGRLSPELHDFLVGEQAPRTYQVTEGTGRKKRTVTKTYTPKTNFQEQEERTARDAKSYGDDLDQAEKLIEQATNADRARLAAADTVADRLTELAAAEWRIGWTGAPDRIPARPIRPATIDDLS